MIDNTNWQRPVTADGKLDVRVGDMWENALGHRGCVIALDQGEYIVRTSIGDVQPWADKPAVEWHRIVSLVSRKGIAWDVPGDKRKGKWVQAWERSFSSLPICIPGVKFDPKDRAAHCAGEVMLWSPDAVSAPEPVRMDQPTPEALDAIIVAIRQEYTRVLAKFSDPSCSMTALTEEVGELAKALLDESPERIQDEAVQVAVVAIRVALQGDPSIDSLRRSRGLVASAVMYGDAMKGETK